MKQIGTKAKIKSLFCYVIIPIPKNLRILCIFLFKLFFEYIDQYKILGISVIPKGSQVQKMKSNKWRFSFLFSGYQFRLGQKGVLNVFVKGGGG